MTGALARSVLAPRSVALVGVSRDATRLSGLALPYLQRAGFRGDIHLVNPSADSAPAGVTIAPAVRALPEGVDLAFVTVGAERTPDIVSGLAERGAGVVVVGASGFSELGPEGARLEEELAAAVAGTDTRLIGPNCNGLYAVQSGVALGFNRSHGRRYPAGGIAIVSQSGALIGAVADLCASHGAGMRGFFSTGNELDVRLVELVEVLATDEETTVIALILDRVGDAARFRAACELAIRNGKRVLAFKFGNTASGRAASQSHSARMAGDSATYDALFERAGVLRCTSLTTLALTASLLESRPAPTRRGALAISTSGAGGALAADALEQHDVPLVGLSEDVERRLAPTLRFVRPGNPVDVGAGGSANARENFAALESTADGTCTVFFYLPPPTPEFATLYGRGFAELAGGARRDRTLGIAVMIDRTDADLVATWLEAGIPVVSSVDEAAEIVGHLQPPAGPVAPSEDAVDATVLSEAESTRIARGAGVAFPRATPAADAASAAVAAELIGFPVVLKGVPTGVAHKSAAGLVALGLADRDAVESAARRVLDAMAALGAGTEAEPLLVVEQIPATGLDLLVSAKSDPEFGVVGLLGLGGTNTEALHAFRVILDPADRDEVRRTLAALGVEAQLRLLGGDPGHAAGLLSDALVALAGALEPAGLASLELNPVRLLATPTRIVALDALAILGRDG